MMIIIIILIISPFFFFFFFFLYPCILVLFLLQFGFKLFIFSSIEFNKITNLLDLPTSYFENYYSYTINHFYY